VDFLKATFLQLSRTPLAAAFFLLPILMIGAWQPANPGVGLEVWDAANRGLGSFLKTFLALVANLIVALITLSGLVEQDLVPQETLSRAVVLAFFFLLGHPFGACCKQNQQLLLVTKTQINTGNTRVINNAFQEGEVRHHYAKEALWKKVTFIMCDATGALLLRCQMPNKKTGCKHSRIASMMRQSKLNVTTAVKNCIRL
jgi:hypothetical protein